MPANNASFKLELGREYVESGEAADIEKIISVFKRTLPTYYPAGHVKRMFHPKTHALLRATFAVRHDLEKEYQVGLFQPGAEYPCWIRLSNAKKKPAADAKKDMRGMAIKLIGVPGKKLLENESNAVTQDFVLVTSKTLQTRSVKDFRKALVALMSGGLKLILFSLTHLQVVLRSIKMISRCSNLMETPFYSTTPYRFGSEDRAVKYAVLPAVNNQSEFPSTPSYNFLKERLENDLSKSDFYFDFMVQFQEHPEKMPVEDPVIEWTSPLVKLATIKIEKQVFNTSEQMEYAEHLSFTPWHCIKEHQPIGGVNRARKEVYIALSGFRHQLNHIENGEPATMKVFT